MEMYGNLILAICVAGACLTTAIGLLLWENFLVP